MSHKSKRVPRRSGVKVVEKIVRDSGEVVEVTYRVDFHQTDSGKWYESMSTPRSQAAHERLEALVRFGYRARLVEVITTR